MREKLRRVVFYSKRDLLARQNLENAEKIIQDFDSSKTRDINAILELYQIKLFFDNEMFLDNWTEIKISDYKAIVESFWKIIQEFLSNINDQNILNYFEITDYNYQDSFWSLLNQLDIYKKISAQNFSNILVSKRLYVRQILKYKKIVDYFSTPIKDHLISIKDSAEILLSYYEEKHRSDTPKLFFPKKLKDTDREAIILDYLESPEVNLNFVRLAFKSQNLKLSDRTKLKAKKLSQKLNTELLESGTASSQGIQVSFSKDQIEPFILEYKDNISNYSYSENWLNLTKLPISAFRNFKLLFKFINSQGCIDLVSKSCEIDSFEGTLMQSKSEYYNSITFYKKHMLSQSQLYMFQKYLKKNEINIEDILSHQVNIVLNADYDIKNLKISFPSEKTAAHEKIRILAPELESIIRQYESYTEEGFINTELIQFSSKPLHLSKLKSKASRKYVYGQGKEFQTLKHYFFSDQCMLYYVEPFKHKYRNFYTLLTSEVVKYDIFKDYQKDDIDFLISEGYLIRDSEDIIKFKNHDIITIIGTLHYHDVVSYWHYPDEIRHEILELEKKGMIRFENTLFTIEERKYLNYHLNKKEFSNGLDLRNKYLHGSNSNSREQQQNDYLIFLKLMILVIYKIKDDLIVFKILNNNPINNT